MATSLGIHYVNGVLQATDWPRRKSPLNSTAVIDSYVLDLTVNQMIDWAASIGACRPKLALQIIATMFSKADWDKVGLLDIIKIDDARHAWKYGGNANPRKIVNPKQFSKYSDLTEVSFLNDKMTLSLLESYFLESLFWGLNNPDKFINYFNSEREKKINDLELYKKAELGVNSIPTLEDMLNEAELIISAYEEKMKTLLSPIPKRLMDDAQSLGVKFDIYSPETKLGAQKKAGLNTQQVEEVVTKELNENLSKLPDAESKKQGGYFIGSDKDEGSSIIGWINNSKNPKLALFGICLAVFVFGYFVGEHRTQDKYHESFKKMIKTNTINFGHKISLGLTTEKREEILEAMADAEVELEAFYASERQANGGW